MRLKRVFSSDANNCAIYDWTKSDVRMEKSKDGLALVITCPRCGVYEALTELIFYNHRWRPEIISPLSCTARQASESGICPTVHQIPIDETPPLGLTLEKIRRSLPIASVRRNKGGLLLGIFAHYGPQTTCYRQNDSKSEKWTGWRWTQSPANFSPAKFPANREKYREFCAFSWNDQAITPRYRVF